MAMKKCKECGNEISKKAKKCPNCGAPVPQAMFSIGGLIFFAIVGWLVYSSYDSPPETQNTLPYNPPPIAAITFALSANDNLGAWRRASESDRLKLCELMARKMDLPRLVPISLKICISETAGDGGLDQMKIAEIAATCAILITQ